MLVALWTIAALITGSHGAICRCTDSKAACWPTQQEWNAFNATIGGRLIAPKPTGSPCHDPHYDAAACQSIRRNRSNAYTRADNAGSMQNENWEGDGNRTCAMDAARTSLCYQGLVPVLGVQVESVQDVQEATRFATIHNLRVVVKTSGHDFFGRSTAAGSLLIWMRKLHNITIHESFAASGHHGPAVTVTGGVLWGEVYDALKSTGYIAVGGMSLTVSATGGFVQGGGHGALGPSFGLAADNVLQYEVVTADATVKVVNECQEPDLFFALRGGGGGTFGVVTSVTYKLHPNPSLVSAILQLSPRTGGAWSTATQEEILTVWSQGTVLLDAARWAGYSSFSSSSFFGNMVVPATETAARTTLTPIVQALSRISNVRATLYPLQSYPTFQDWHTAIYGVIFPQTGTDSTGSYGVLGSRIIPVSALEDARGLAKTIVAAMAGESTVRGHMVVGPGVREGDPDGATAVTPAWRKGVWHLTIWTGWRWNSSEEEKAAARKRSRSYVETLQAAFPDAGAYVNEASVDEPDWTSSFWGMKNYARLAAIKLQVDPSGLFLCRQCVGSESWSDENTCI